MAHSTESVPVAFVAGTDDESVEPTWPTENVQPDMTAGTSILPRRRRSYTRRGFVTRASIYWGLIIAATVAAVILMLNMNL